MNVFIRTSSGLNNLPDFHNVEFIVYLEGGNQAYSVEEVYAGMYHRETEDIIFWRYLFDIFCTKTTKFKSVGSKTTIKEIANDIIMSNTKRSFVAMDNEFDEILNKRIFHPQVLYTHGYSWENDVWNKDVIKYVVEELTAIQITNKDLEKNFDSFIDKMKIAVLADGFLFKNGLSFFPRKKGIMFCVDCQPKDLPYIIEAKIHAIMQTHKLDIQALNKFGKEHSIDVCKFCFGHFLADYCYLLISNYVKKRHSISMVSKDVVFRMGIKKFFDICFSESTIFEYYNRQFHLTMNPSVG